MRDQLYVSLDLLGSLPQPVVVSVGEQIISGVVTLVKSHRDVIVCVHEYHISAKAHSLYCRSHTEWALVFALMRMAMAQPEASRQSFDLLLSLTSEGPDQCVHADNFVGIINLLDEYATTAGSVAERQQKERRSSNAQSPQCVLVFMLSFGTY
jgi:brefeldin A-resistance guanine nucleotide exchange factor 1